MTSAPAPTLADAPDRSRRLLQLLLDPAFWLNGPGLYVLLAAFFLFAAIVQTWPLILHASDSLINFPVRPEDSWAYLWSLWWVKDATLHLDKGVLHTDERTEAGAGRKA